ncbi:iron transporter [Haloarcula litorea]|uniref:iron transporter n=1 Tax=Haloarcula litorea TaxID=3032579 RepID=UPI0023E7A77F|nr:iron transporter [Halomicroarcula sp. GDY20]
MDRRTLLRTGAGLAGSLALAGCLGGLETQSTRAPPLVEDRPDGVYVPSHVEGMEMAGTNTGGDFAFGLMYSYPHRFWTVTGDTVERTDIAAEDDLHLMTSVWDPETGTVIPDTGLSVEIYRDGSLVSQEVIYPMLSQPMGFHYGANFGLEGDGDYTVRLSVGALSTRRTGSFRDRFTEPASVDVPLAYSQAATEEISYERLTERAGERGAVDPMSMEMLPGSVAPSASELPGTVLGSARSDDADLLVTVLDSPPAGIDADGQYLAVSARTRYNRMLIPSMALSGTLSRDGEPVFDGEFVRTLDPDLRYHYGAVVDGVESGDELTLRPTVQPQTARHEGYETAFGGLGGGMPEVSLSVE